jgi:hypothetical protein
MKQQRKIAYLAPEIPALSATFVYPGKKWLAGGAPVRAPAALAGHRSGASKTWFQNRLPVP